MRRHLGHDPPRDQHLALAIVFVYLHDRFSVYWSVGRLCRRHRDGMVIIPMSTQTIIALVIVVLAALWAGWLLVGPFVASLRPPKKDDSCTGGCGCGHEDRHAH